MQSGVQLWSWTGPDGLEPTIEASAKQDLPVTCLKALPPSNNGALRLMSGNVVGELSFFETVEEASGLELTPKATLTLSDVPLTAIDLQLERDHALIVGESGKYWIYDIEKQSPVSKSRQASESAIGAAKWISPDSFLVASHASELQVWDLRESNDKPSRVLKENVNAHSVVDRRIWSIDTNPARPWLTCSAVSGPSQDLRPTVMFHDLRAAPQPVLVNQSLHFGHLWKVAFHPDQPDHVISCSDDGTLLMWDTSSAFEHTVNLKPSSIGSKFQGNNIKALRNDGLPINTFQIDTSHNLVISSSDAEAITFNTDLF